MNRTTVAGGIRSFLAGYRTQRRRRAHPLAIAPASELAAKVAGHLLGEGAAPLRPVINATGILIHPELGRTPLADKAIERIAAIARDYANLDLDLRTSERGRRHDAVSGLLKQLTGAETAFVANNNAGAILVALAALAAGREVIVSRGELLELDDGLRIPDLITTSGARLCEVGTANKTRIDDYRRVLSKGTAAILRIESSGRDQGASTLRPSLAELVDLARGHSVPVIQDIGAGGWIQIPGASGAWATEVANSLQRGADLVLSCGDTRLGGPECGIIVGQESLIGRLLDHPLARVVRVDKLTLSALAATLELVREQNAAMREVPLWQLVGTPVENLRQRAERIASQIISGGAVDTVEARESAAYLTDSCQPAERVPSWSVSLSPRGIDAAQLASRLRQGTRSVIGRVELRRLDLDLRTVFPRQDADIVAAIDDAK